MIYYGHESDYGAHVFARGDFDRMATMLRTIQGRFLLSLNDHPDVRKLFAAFQIEGVETSYTLSAAGSRRVGEVLISNISSG